MFSTAEFIEVSRKFVCIRIETYENKESEQLVKRVLNGKMANTAFAVIDPQGTKMLTRGARSPSMAMSDNRGRTDTSGSENEELIARFQQIAARFESRGSVTSAGLQDFHSLRQALNCASADQRLLVFVNAPADARQKLEQRLKPVFADKDIIGKFHLNFVDPKSDAGWPKVIDGAKSAPGILVVRSSQFGTDGQAMAQLNLSAGGDAIKQAMLDANTRFTKVEKRKDYENHVKAGRRQGVFFENEISKTESFDGKGKGGKRGRGR